MPTQHDTSIYTCQLIFMWNQNIATSGLYKSTCFMLPAERASSSLVFECFGYNYKYIVSTSEKEHSPVNYCFFEQENSEIHVYLIFPQFFPLIVHHNTI